MSSAFQSGAFQVSGFQIVAVADTASGGYGFGAYDPYRRKERPRRRLRLRKKRDLGPQIARLEALLAEERKTSIEAIRLEADTRKRVLPDAVLRTVQQALRVQSDEAFRAAQTALSRLEQDEEEEFAVLWALLH